MLCYPLNKVLYYSQLSFMLLYNFNATCFGLSTKRHHQPKLDYEIKVLEETNYLMYLMSQQRGLVLVNFI